MQGQSIFQLMNPLILLLFAAGFVVLAINQKQLKSAKWFAGVYICSATAFIIDFFRDVLPLGLASISSNVLYMATAVLVVIGFAVRCESRIPWKLMMTIGSVQIGLYLYFFITQDSILFRSISSTIGNATFFLIAALVIKKAMTSWLDRVFFGIVLVLSLQLYLRIPISVLLSDVPATADAYAGSFFALSLHLVAGIFGVFMAMALFVGFGMDIITDLQKRSVTDVLTGINNRRGFEEKSAELIFKATGDDVPVCVLLADIDHFKLVNDTYGHAFGDEVIAKIARLFAAQEKGKFVAGRLGGEEFALVGYGLAMEDAVLLAEQLRTQFAAAPFKTVHTEQFFTASFGIAQHKPGEAILDMISRADEALYLAKARGRNRVISEKDLPAYLMKTRFNDADRRANRDTAAESQTTATVISVPNVS